MNTLRLYIHTVCFLAYAGYCLGQDVKVNVEHASAAGMNDGRICLEIDPSIASPFNYSFYEYHSRTLIFEGNTSSYNICTGYNLSPGIYCFVLLDGNCCAAEGCSEVLRCKNFEISGFEVTHQCENSSNGSITVNLTVPIGSSQNFSYQWEKWPGPTPIPQTTATITDLASGRYSVTVTDEVGCSDSKSVVVSAVRPVWVTLTDISSNSCPGQGYIEAAIRNPAFPPYTYHWSNGASGARIENLDPGTYAVTVEDVNGCETEAGPWTINGSTLSISDNPNITELTNFCGLKAKKGFWIQGSPPYTYDWSGVSQWEEWSQGNGATAWIEPGDEATVTITDNQLNHDLFLYILFPFQPLNALLLTLNHNT